MSFDVFSNPEGVTEEEASQELFESWFEKLSEEEQQEYLDERESERYYQSLKDDMF